MLNRVFSAIEAIKSVTSRATSHNYNTGNPQAQSGLVRGSQGRRLEASRSSRHDRIQVGTITKLARRNISTLDGSASRTRAVFHKASRSV